MTTMRGVKLSNEYAKLLGRLYADTPKAVLAAVMVSYMIRCDGELMLMSDRAQALLADEWQILYENGIVPQKPTAKSIQEIQR